MRSSSSVLIYLNLRKALEDGIDVFRSENNVILCSGLGWWCRWVVGCNFVHSAV